MIYLVTVATPPCTLLHLPDVPISPDLVNQADPGEDWAGYHDQREWEDPDQDSASRPGGRADQEVREGGGCKEREGPGTKV